MIDGPEMKGVPVRLYVDHEPRNFPDAILLSEATIAFAKGLQEISFIIDPTEQVAIGLWPSQDGSFWQNTFLKAQAEYKTRAHLYNVAAAAMIWFVQPPLERLRGNWWAPLLDQYFPEITPADRIKAQEKAVEIGSGHVAEKERQTAYQAFSKDQAVTGVGVNVVRVRPPLLVQRPQFFSFAGPIDATTFGEERVTTSFERAVLISPVLELGTRRWRLRTSKGEIGADIKDQAWLENAVAGRLAVPLSGGIRMEIKLETREKKVDGLWRPIEHHVLEVINVEAPASQAGLFT